MDVPVKFGDSRSSCSRDIRLSHFVQTMMTTQANGPYDNRANRHLAVGGVSASIGDVSIYRDPHPKHSTSGDTIDLNCTI